MKKTMALLLAVLMITGVMTGYSGPIKAWENYRADGIDQSVTDDSEGGGSDALTGSPTNDTTTADLVAIDGLTKEKKEEYEQDGTLAERQAFAMELQAANEAYYTTFSVEVDDTVNVSDIANILPNEYAPNMPTAGTAKVLAFLVDFPDVPHDNAVTKESAEQVFFGEEDSLTSTYYASSYGQLTISGDVQDWYTAKHNKEYYAQNGIGLLYQEVLDAFDAQIDYSQYDADDNGYIDGLYLHFAGDDTGWGSTFWSYVTFIGRKQYDNISIGDRVCLLHTLNVQTICHESGHLLGLPDYYSYTLKTILGNFNWVGADMMVDGSADFNAVSKMQLGWIKQVKLLQEDGQYTLSDFSEDGDAAIIYPFGESEGDSFLVVEKTTDFFGDDILKVLRVNAKTVTAGDGNSTYYIHGNMYGDVPFIELIRDMKNGDSLNPYDQANSTHYYNDEEEAITFSGITIDLGGNALSPENAVFDLSFEMAPSKTEPPVIHVTASVNQITATIDYSVPFAIDTQVVPYLEDSNGQRIATMDVKAIFGDSGYFIDKASCVLKVASYMEWGFDGKNEITVGSDQDYLLQPGATYTVVVPTGAFRTVMGDIEELRIEVTADATADTTKKYQAISSFDRCSEFITLSDGRAAYAYVKSEDNILRLALLSEDGTTEEYVIAEDILGYAGLCQLSDGTLAIAATGIDRIRALYYKFDLTSGSVINTLEQLIDEFELTLHAFEGGFYSASTYNSTNRKTFYIDNAFTKITEVLPELSSDAAFVVTGTRKYVVGDKILYIVNDTEEEYFSPDSPPEQTETNKHRFTLYNADGSEYATTALLGFGYDVQLLGVDVDHNGNYVLAYAHLKEQKIQLLVFDEHLHPLQIIAADFPIQRINTEPLIINGTFFKCVADGYFLCYEYVRQYNPTGLVGFFDTETYQQGWLLDGNFHVKSVFDVAYKASAAALGIEGNRFIVGDEYGYYTVATDLTAEMPAVTLSSDKYVVDNDNQTITNVPTGTTANELLKFIQCNQNDFRYEFRYTHAERSAAVSGEQVLSCKYELVVYTQNDTLGTVYTLPDLPLNKEDMFNISRGGVLMNYTATEPNLVVPDFVKEIVDTYSVDLSCVTSLTTSADIYNLILPNLTSLNLEGCKKIYGLSFCPNLKEVIIPDTVTELSYDAFSNCSGLEKVVIPTSVTRIARGVFEYIDNENLKIIYLGTREQWDMIDFRTFDFSSYDDLYDWEAVFGKYLTFAGSGVYEPAPVFQISGAFLSQENNLQIDFRVKKALFDAGGYVQPYIEFIFNSEIYYVSEYTVQGDDYIFSFPNIAPDQINDILYATLYATYRGTLYHSDTLQSSVATCLKNVSFTAPDKLIYLEGKDTLDVTGGKITLTYYNDTTEVIDLTASMVSGFDNTKVGKQTLTVTYGGFTDTFEVEIIAKSLSSIKVTTKPSKLTYLEGKDTLNVTGGKVTLTYNNDTTEDIDLTASMVSGFDNTKVGKQTLTVTYGGFTDTFEVEVIAKSLSSIKVTTKPSKLTYLEGKDTLNVVGGKVTLTYNNDTTEDIDLTASMVSGFDNTKVGKQTLTVTYGGKTTTFDVEIVAKSLSSIKVTTKPSKLTYTEGEDFSASGMVVTAYYNNDTSAVIKDYKTSGYTSTPGSKTITVTYGGKTATFTVTVEKKKHMKGDANLDGKVTITDMLAIKSHLLGKSNLTGDEFLAADTNEDGKVTITDFIQVKSHLLGKSQLNTQAKSAAVTQTIKKASVYDEKNLFCSFGNRYALPVAYAHKRLGSICIR